MPIFQYKGYGADGKEVRGAVEAMGRNDAIAAIREKKILPTDVFEADKKKKDGFFRRRDEAFLPNMTRQFSILVSAGVPIMEALQSLSIEYHGFYRNILIEIKDRVSSGTTLFRAMEEYENIFPSFYIHMVQAGEASGTLDDVLAKLADFLEHETELRSKIRSSMVYPILMIGVSMIVLSFLFTFVIPKIVKIFADTKSTLPLITIILIYISNAFTKYWWAMFAAVVGVCSFIRTYLPKNRLKVDRWLLKVPGNIVQTLYYARFARAMEILLSGGVPVLIALKLSAKSVGNQAMEAMILKAGESVAEGRAISSSLEGFPPIFLQMVATGEKTGKLADTMKKAASSYEAEFNRKIDKAVAALEPAMVLVMGCVVCFIVLAVLLPIFQLNQLIK
jgi:general secretion pathway protein F